MEKINQIDLLILNRIYEFLQCELLDRLMPIISWLGNNGAIWVLITVILLLIPKYRPAGFAMGISLLLCLLVGNITLKPLIARMRPFTVNTDFVLLIPKPMDFGFPSGHTMSSFAGAFVIFLYHKKWGIAALLLAALIALSRLYLYVHYPTDILAGILFGVALAFWGNKMAKYSLRYVQGEYK